MFVCWKPLSPSRPHAVCDGGRQGGNGLSRESISQIPLQEFRFLGSPQSRHQGLSQLSLLGQDGQPAEPCLEVLMAGHLVSSGSGGGV